MSETAKRDPNYVTTLMGVDMSTGLIPTKLYVDETTHRLLVSAVITSGGGESPNNIFMEYDSADNNLIYIGEAANGSSTSDPVWKITRLDLTNLLAVTYADGNLSYDNIWANRESLSYT